MKVLAVIPARGGSKGIPLKNIVPLAGKPLLSWTIEAALASRSIGLTVVSTEHPEIADYARKMGVTLINRPKEISQDDTPTAPVIFHAWEEAWRRGFEADVVVTLQPTSPLRRTEHIDEAVELFSRHPEADSLVSVQQVPHQFTPECVSSLDDCWLKGLGERRPIRRQDKAVWWARNGAAIYITRPKHLKHYVWGGRVLAYKMDKLTSVDIDDEADLTIAEAILNNIK